MKKNRLIFYLVFALFHIGAFIFTITLDGNTDLMFQMIGWVPWFKWITFFGLVMLCADVVWSWITNKESQREKSALTHELHTLKAKLFDLQESEKQAQQNQKIKP
jgi:hypothetical protein